MAHLRHAAAISLILLVAGCATAPEQVAPDWADHSAALTALESWSFSGKIALKTRHGADSASLEWRQVRDDLQFTVSGPVGIKQATNNV